MASQAVLELLVQLRDQASAGLGTLGNALGTLGGIAGGVALAGVTALGAGIVSGIGDAREAALIMAQTEAVIKSTGGAAGVSAQQIADYAGSLSAASGQSLFGDSQIQESTNLLLTFTEIKGKTLEAATAISVDMAQALGGAPKDAAIQLGKALNDPIAGVTALSRVGVSFTEQQKEQIKTLQESGDVAGAQAIILAELNKEFGGSAKAAADADGGMAKFNDSIGEAFEGIGTKLLPILNRFADWLNSPQVQQAIATFAEVLGNGIATAADWIANQLIPALIDLYNWLAPRLGPVLEFLIKALGTDVPNGIRVVVETWEAWKAALLGFKEQYIDPIVNGFKFILLAIGDAQRSFESFMNGLAQAVIPDWLRGHSPPPLADWFTNISHAADLAGGSVGGFNDTLAPAANSTANFFQTISGMATQASDALAAIPPVPDQIVDASATNSTANFFAGIAGLGAAAPAPTPAPVANSTASFFAAVAAAGSQAPATTVMVDARGSTLTEQQIKAATQAGVNAAIRGSADRARIR